VEEIRFHVGNGLNPGAIEPDAMIAQVPLHSGGGAFRVHAGQRDAAVRRMDREAAAP
jgi:hypothetical protein